MAILRCFRRSAGVRARRVARSAPQPGALDTRAVLRATIPQECIDERGYSRVARQERECGWDSKRRWRMPGRTCRQGRASSNLTQLGSARAALWFCHSMQRIPGHPQRISRTDSSHAASRLGCKYMRQTCGTGSQRESAEIRTRCRGVNRARSGAEGRTSTAEKLLLLRASRSGSTRFRPQLALPPSCPAATPSPTARAAQSSGAHSVGEPRTRAEQGKAF